MAYRSFEDLVVWKESCDLAVRVYEVLESCSDYGLKNQMTRSAVSIASNIAEGAERNSAPDFIRFLHIAKGSAAELRTQSIIAARVGKITQEQADEIIAATRKLGGQLQVLAKSLKPKT
jgi:four helix bundle protein